MKKDKPYKLWIVALTERYEVEVSAPNRRTALEMVEEFGGGSPVFQKITATPHGGKIDE